MVLYDSTTLQPRLLAPPNLFAAKFEVHETGAAIASRTGEGQFQVNFLSPAPRLLAVKAHTSPVTGLAYNPSGSLLLSFVRSSYPSARDPSRINMWRHPSYEFHRSLGYPLLEVHQVAFHPDGTILAVADGTSVKLFETDTFSLVGDVAIPIGAPKAMEFSPDGSLLAVGGSRRGIALLSA